MCSTKAEISITALVIPSASSISPTCSLLSLCPFARRIAPSWPAPSEVAVITKAVLRAADHLGLSEATVSRMRGGTYLLQPSQKPFELAMLLVRLYRSLDAIVGGDAAAAQAWLRNDNSALAGRPLAPMQTIPGLMQVIAYLDARRAVV